MAASQFSCDYIAVCMIDLVIILVSNYMFLGSRNTVVTFKSQRQVCVGHSNPRWQTKWPPVSFLVTISQSITCVCLLPIIHVSRTDRSVQMTFLTRLERVAKHVCGVTSNCVVTRDTGLYRPVQQLIMSRSVMDDRWILRPGELHMAFVVLIAIGLFIDGTGIGDVWSILYSEQHLTTSQHPTSHFRLTCR